MLRSRSDILRDISLKPTSLVSTSKNLVPDKDVIGWSQNHPLYAQDRALVDEILAQDQPNDHAITTAGRLFVRYNGFPGAKDIKADLDACLKKWGMDRNELNSRCMKIWHSGYRPGQIEEELSVGSGAN